jgi:hypothetical protein
MELLVAVPITLMVFGAIVLLQDGAAKGQKQVDGRVRSLLEQQIGVERMTRELRQATSVASVTPQTFDAVTWVAPPGGGAAVQRRVYYDCGNGSCKRWEGPAGGSLTSGPVTVLSGVTSTGIFTLLPNSTDPNYVSINVSVSVAGARNPIAISGGFALRNLSTHE